MQSPTQCTFDHSILSYALHFETLYNGQAVTTNCLQSHCMFHNGLINWPKFTDSCNIQSLSHTQYIIFSTLNRSQCASNCINLCVISSVLRLLNFCLSNILLFLRANYFHSTTTSFNEAITISQYTPWQKTYGCVAVQIHTFLTWHGSERSV